MARSTVGAIPTASKTQSAPRPACQFHDSLQRARLAGVHRLRRAEFSGQVQFAGGDIDRDDLLAARQAQRLHQKKADQPGADDDGAIARGRVWRGCTA